MATVNCRCWSRSARAWFSSMRRLSRPVSGSVDAWNSRSLSTRTIASRVPTRWLIASTRVTMSSSGTFSTGPAMCSTPTDRPAIATGHAHAEARATGSVTQLRARVDLFAVGEHHRARAARRDALVRLGDRAAGRGAVGAGDEHALEVRVTVVGEQQLGRQVGHRAVQRALEHVEHVDLGLGHLERVAEPGRELAPLRLRFHHALAREVPGRAGRGRRAPTSVTSTTTNGRSSTIAMPVAARPSSQLPEVGEQRARHDRRDERRSPRALRTRRPPRT